MQNKTARDRGSKLTGDPGPAAVSSDLQVVIPHRTPQLTRAALDYAAALADDLNVRLRLIDVHVVPWGVPLDEPTVNPRYLTRRIRSLAQESTLPVSAEVIYARDWEQGGQDEIFYLGPHAPHLTPKEIDLLHGIWLELSNEVAPDEIHHHDVVHFALEELQHEMTDGQRQGVLRRLKQHLEQIKNRRAPAFR